MARAKKESKLKERDVKDMSDEELANSYSFKARNGRAIREDIIPELDEICNRWCIKFGDNYGQANQEGPRDD